MVQSDKMWILGLKAPRSIANNFFSLFSEDWHLHLLWVDTPQCPGGPSSTPHRVAWRQPENKYLAVSAKPRINLHIINPEIIYPGIISYIGSLCCINLSHIHIDSYFPCEAATCYMISSHIICCFPNLAPVEWSPSNLVLNMHSNFHCTGTILPGVPAY